MSGDMALATVKFRHVVIRRGFIRLRPFGARSGQALPWVEESRLRAELFGVDQLEPHPQALAGWHDLDKRRGPDLCSRGWMKMSGFASRRASWYRMPAIATVA
jgi:hypothetical protein